MQTLEQTITQYSWWQSKSGRLFVIVWICLANDENLTAIREFYPDQLALLEKGKADTEKIPFEKFADLVNRGEMIKVETPA